MSLASGDRARVRSTGACGRVAFVGGLRGKAGRFVGVALDEPLGKNDGTVAGDRYFQCAPGHGTFVRPENVEPLVATAEPRRRPPASASMAMAARSHELTEAYMDDFQTGLAALGMPTANDESKHSHSSSPSSGTGFRLEDFRDRFFGGGGGGGGGVSGRAAWGGGPADPQGVLFDASDRPLLCASVSPDGRECVVGGCDHGLKVFDVFSGKQRRNLFSKRFGHREWVTGVTYCPDGAVLSAGMDSKLCLWRGSQCADLEGHSGSVSKVAVTASGAFAVSCSYDKSVRVWDLGACREAGCFTGHKAPILEMALAGGLLLTGARDGVALAWDVASGRPARLNSGQHKGHVTALKAIGAPGHGEPKFASGDQAGTLRLWDLRTRGAVAQQACLHPGGAVNEVESAGENTIVSAGADKIICVSDVRRLDAPLLTLAHHKDFIYSLKATPSHVFSGAGDGMLLVHDLASGKLKFGLGANAAGVRCIELADNVLVAAGDDGNALTYHFPRPHK